MGERRTNLRKREYFEQLRTELTERLRRLSGAMSHDELAALTARMTRLRLKYELSTGLPEVFGGG